jgi:hypothetical protein
MTEDLDKWGMVVPAVQQVITATAASISWGLKVFPLGDKAGECSTAGYPAGVLVDVAPNNANAMNGTIGSLRPLGDGTPTGDAVNEAVKYLQTLQNSDPKYILLATDGEPSCTGTTKDGTQARTAAVTAVTNAATAGIHTFVLGIATSDKYADVLNQLADAGLEARPEPNPIARRYYLAGTQAELVDVFSRITAVVATCTFPLAKPAPDPNLVNVYVGDRVEANAVPRDTTSTNGWNYVGDDNLTLQLFGSACDRVGAQSVQVDYVCPGDIVY